MMDKNKPIVEEFFNAFSVGQVDKMLKLLDENIIYNDPIFGVLNGEEVRDMWMFKCNYLKDFSLTINAIDELDEEYATCNWTAKFFRNQTGHYLTMNIKSYLKIDNGKITEQSDAYKLSDWLAKVYGLKGRLFGWTGVMKKNEQIKYRGLLEKYVKASQLFKSGGKRQHDYDLFDQ